MRFFRSGARSPRHASGGPGSGADSAMMQFVSREIRPFASMRSYVTSASAAASTVPFFTASSAASCEPAYVNLPK